MSTPDAPPPAPIHLVDAGQIGYREAWDMQLRYHEAVAAGQYPAGVLILLEHPPVITMGRRQGVQQHLLASPSLLQARGVDVVETDRGGDITFHGPGQLVAYPILPLNTYRLNLHAYLRLLEQAAIDTLARFHIPAFRDPFPACATGVWVGKQENPEKITAIGIKVRRWITLHGLALNVSTDLSYFSLINPCGLSRPVTSMQKILGPATPSMPDVKAVAAQAFQSLLKDRPASHEQSQPV